MEEENRGNSLKLPTLPAKANRPMTTAGYVLEKSLRYLAIVGSMFLLVAMVAVLVDIVGRLVKMPVYGVEELNTLLLVGCIFLGIPYAQTIKMHLSVSIFTDRLPKKMAAYLNCGVLVAALLFLIIFIYQCSMQAYWSFIAREYSQGIIQFPVYPSRWLIVIGLMLLGVQLISDIVTELKKIAAFKAVD